MERKPDSLDQWWAKYGPRANSGLRKYLIRPAEGPSTWIEYVIFYICVQFTALHKSV
jgi:hypothetical protein